jgi:hypothetical protein
MSEPVVLRETAERLAERIVRVETKLDFLISQMDRPPPSPVCVTKHREHDDRITALESWRNRAIGVVMVINILLVIFIDKVKQFFTLN